MWTYSMLWKLGLLLLLTWTGLYFIISNDLQEVTKAYVEISGAQGGFTKELYDDFIEDLGALGFDPNETDINIQALSPTGEDISHKAINITPIGITPYPSEPIYLPRGTKITIEVRCKTDSLLNKAYEFFGLSSTFSQAEAKKVYMSERVR